MRSLKQKMAVGGLGWESSSSAFAAGADGPAARGDQLVLGRNAPFVHGPAEALFAIDRGLENGFAGQMRDTAMARLEQGFGRGKSTHEIAGDHRGIAQFALVAIEQHRGQFAETVGHADLAGDQRGIENADGFLRDQQVDGGLFRGRIGAGAEGGDGHVLQGGFVAGAHDEGRGEGGSGDFIDDEADDALAAFGHGMGLAAAIARGLGGIEHAAPCGAGHPGIGNAVEHRETVACETPANSPTSTIVALFHVHPPFRILGLLAEQANRLLALTHANRPPCQHDRSVIR
ncbi:hypothetical protein N8D56_07795 [Devosia sp. A8/3-2]|nr:hypothetical protein N8D56_07795 [Devosia sp. A8/3-2]